MNKKAKPPVWYWIVSFVAMLWGANGVLSFILKECQWGNVFSGITIGLGISVFAGLIGSILLSLKNSYAGVVYVISFLAILIQQGYWVFMSRDRVSMVYLITSLLIGLAMILFSRTAKNKGWLV